MATTEKVREFVLTHQDDSDIDPDDLEGMFFLAYGRSSDAEDREQGLWSHIVAAADED